MLSFWPATAADAAPWRMGSGNAFAAEDAPLANAVFHSGDPYGHYGYGAVAPHGNGHRAYRWGNGYGNVVPSGRYRSHGATRRVIPHSRGHGRGLHRNLGHARGRGHDRDDAFRHGTADWRRWPPHHQFGRLSRGHDGFRGSGRGRHRRVH